MAFGVDVEAGGEGPSAFFNIEASNGDRCKEGVNIKEEGCVVFLRGSVDKVLGESQGVGVVPDVVDQRFHMFLNVHGESSYGE